MPDFAIGVDLGGTNLRIAAVDTQGNMLETVSTGTQITRPRAEVIRQLCDAVRSMASKYSSGGKWLGAGIGVPGIIDKRTGRLRESANLPGWHEFPVREDIERELGVPVILENDANAAALGENWLGAAAGMDDMLMITLGTGVGGGIVLRQQIWHGMTGMAGELGHVTVDPNGPPCGCGNQGCVEQYASATAIARMAREKVEKGSAPDLASLADGAPVNARHVYSMAVRGYEPAQEIFHRVGWALGILFADLVNAFNLHMYVVGGGVSAAWDMFSPALFAELTKRSTVYTATAPPDHMPPKEPHHAGRPTIVARAILGGDAGLYGAARIPMVAQEVMEKTHLGAQGIKIG